MELTLQPEVAAKYDLVIVKPGIYHFPGFGEIDVTKLTVKSADALVGRGFAWLVVKAAPVKATKAAAASTPPAPEPPKDETTAAEVQGADEEKSLS